MKQIIEEEEKILKEEIQNYMESMIDECSLSMAIQIQEKEQRVIENKKQEITKRSEEELINRLVDQKIHSMLPQLIKQICRAV